MQHATRYRSRREFRTEPSEDSDIVVALFRLLVVIAFTLVSIRTWGAADLGVTAVFAAGALYTLLLFASYLMSRRGTGARVRQQADVRPLWGALLRRRLKIQRGVALLVDLSLVTAIMHDLRYDVLQQQAILDLYYVIVVVGALWFHREGGILTAALAAACLTLVFHRYRQAHPDQAVLPLYNEVAPRALVCMIIGVVTGYVARARSGERRQRERNEWELSVAGEVQAEMLPQRLPEPPGFEVGAVFVPARVVGGDYYDAMIAPDGRLFVAVADVAGKSVQAVMQLSLLRSHLHEAIAEGLAPGEIAGRLNDVLLSALTPGRFISLFCGAIDLESGRVSFVNCGHTPPLILDTDETEGRRLFTGNIVLGIDAEARFDERSDALNPGAYLVICTDGVTESMGGGWRPFGATGVAKAVRPVAGAGPDEVARAVLAASERHTTRARPDDATILVVRRSPYGGTRTSVRGTA